MGFWDASPFGNDDAADFAVALDEADSEACVVLRRGRPVGWSNMNRPVDAGYSGKTVAGILGHLGAERVLRRYGALFDRSERRRLRRALEAVTRRGAYFYSGWIFLDASRVVGSTARPDFGVALLTRAQIEALGWEFI